MVLTSEVLFKVCAIQIFSLLWRSHC